MRFACLASMLLVTGCGCVSVPTHEDLAATTHRLEAGTGNRWVVCASTAMSANTLRTAEHCVAGATQYAIDKLPVNVAKVTEVAADVVDVTLAAPMFKQWAHPGHIPKQGDRVRWWGEPEGVSNVYRQGAVAAVQGDVIAIDAMVCHGDSGAGLFNDRGEIVGIVVQMRPQVGKCTFAVGQS